MESLIVGLISFAVFWLGWGLGFKSAETNNTKGEDKMSKEEKEVLAVITEEECEEFEDIAMERGAIKETIQDLVDKRKELRKRHKQLWDKITEKYDLPNKALSLSRETGEITIDD